MIVTERSLLDSLQAYVNRFETPNSREDLLAIASSILTFRKVEAESLIQQVKSKFNLTNALAQVIDPKSLANAEKLVHLLKFESLEKLLQDTLLGNQDLINRTLENVTESLVENELAKILGSDAVNLDIDVDAQQLMIKQVTLKFNVMQSSAPPSKSSEEISAQMDDEIERFKSSRPLPFRLF